MGVVPEPFDPDAVKAFRYLGFRWDDRTAAVELRYALDDLELSEVIRFPAAPRLTGARAEAFQRVLRLLWLVAGASYYKAAAPPTVVAEGTTLTDAEVSFTTAVLLHGLGEYRFRNGLDPSEGPAWEVETERRAPLAAGSLGLARRAVVGIGGGKDSCVTLQALLDSGLAGSPLLASVRRFPVIDGVLERSALEHRHVERTLSPVLLDLNARGARNGHVPVTAIVSLILVALALREGCDAVVMSNERSASEATLRWAGVEVNHQWSKSAEAEAELQAALIAAIGPDLAWFSLLRPLSELAITGVFARRCTRFFDVFSSCNRAFQLDPARRVDGWCGRCPKCRFVGLALAPWLSPQELVAIQDGHDVLGDLTQLDGFLALVGAGMDKPFECVGELAESRVAIALLSADARWRTRPAVAAVAARLAADGAAAGPDDLARVFTVDPAPLVPVRFQPVVAHLAAEVAALRP